MFMRKIYASVDIGTSSIKIVTLEVFNKKYNVLASTIVKTKGLKQGLIVDAGKVSSAIKQGIKIVESKLGTKIEQVLAIIPSHNIEFDVVASSIKVDTEDKLVTSEVIYSCLQTALTSNLKVNKEIITVSPVEYRLDKTKNIKNPLNMRGDTLSVKAVVSAIPKKNILSVVSVLEDLGIEVVDVLFSSAANYYAVKTADLDTKVVAMIDIGDEITKVSIFNKGVMIKEKNILLGGVNIDNDISFKYKTTMEQSREIKEQFAVCNRKYADVDEEVTYINRLNESVTIDQYRLSEMIESRIVEMLKNMKNEINSLTNREIGYIIITGGITSMLGFNAIVEELFPRNASVINLGLIGIRDNRYASAYGIIKYFVEKLELRGKEYTMFQENKIEEMLSTRKKVGASGVLSKIFEKIFD